MAVKGNRNSGTLEGICLTDVIKIQYKSGKGYFYKFYLLNISENKSVTGRIPVENIYEIMVFNQQSKEIANCVVKEGSRVKVTLKLGTRANRSGGRTYYSTTIEGMQIVPTEVGAMNPNSDKFMELKSRAMGEESSNGSSDTSYSNPRTSYNANHSARNGGYETPQSQTAKGSQRNNTSGFSSVQMVDADVPF
ncbi:hypothetical protein [Halobacteriovorax sp. ZH2_bin.1]|uniref:hypothetical protein n=1 Tax=unclassified Halobacteriovorax TaxID=2639665 RepID=UPI003719EAF2